MLYNYSFAVSKERIQSELGKVVYSDALESNYNLSAGDKGYVITAQKPMTLERMEWGLIPEWSKDGINHGYLLSTGMQGIVSKTSFRIPVRRRRCLVLADSFYVWSKEKIPYRVVRRDGALITFAGVWEIWRDSTKIKKSFSIILCPSNKEVFQRSEQMPVMLTNQDERNMWLFSEALNDALTVLKTTENALFNLYRITPKLADPSFNKSEIHAVVPDIKTLFD